MLVGDPILRSAEGHTPKNCFRCFTGPNFEGDNAAPCQDPKLDTPYFPKTPCLGEIRTNVHFPTSVITQDALVLFLVWLTYYNL